MPTERRPGSPRPRSHRLRRQLLTALTGALLGVLGLSLPLTPAAAAEVEFTIDDPDVERSAGLAVDPGNDRYWTVNDSSDEPQALAVDADGEVEGAVVFGAEVSDLEAAAFTGAGLYVADIGDDEQDRDFVTVYRLSSPEPGGNSFYNAWDLQYEDGEAHDAEAIVVTEDEELLVITKEEDGGIWAPTGELTGQAMNTLERVGDAPSYVTDATALPDGTLAVRDYGGLTVLDPDDDYAPVASAALPEQQQGETITTTLDGEELLVGSTGAGADVLRVPVPTELDPGVPAGGPTPVPPAPTPSGEGSVPDDEGAQEVPGGEDDAASSTALPTLGTVLLVAVPVVLVLAAVVGVVLLRRRARPRRVSGPQHGSPAEVTERISAVPPAAPSSEVPGSEPTPSGRFAVVERHDGDAAPADREQGSPRRAMDPAPVVETANGNGTLLPIPSDMGSAAVIVDDVHVEYKVYASGKALDKAGRKLLTRTRGVRTVHALKGVSFTAERGESIGVIGSNGSGKSTLMRAITGLTPPSRGAIYASARPNLLGVGAALLPELSGERNIVLGGLALGFSKEEIAEMRDDIVAFAELEDFIELPMRTYSSGMQQRLKFAIAAAKQHEILIVDEALAVGDKRFRERSESRIRAIRENAGTIFLVSHSMGSIRDTCSRAIWLEKGVLREDGDPDEVIKAYEDWKK